MLKSTRENTFKSIVLLVYSISTALYLYTFLVGKYVNGSGDTTNFRLIYFFSKYPDFNSKFLADMAHGKIWHSFIGLWNVFVGSNDAVIMLSPNLLNSLLLAVFLMTVFVVTRDYFNKSAALYATMAVLVAHPILGYFFAISDLTLTYLFFMLALWAIKNIEKWPPMLSIFVLGVTFFSSSLTFFLISWIIMLLFGYFVNPKIAQYFILGLLLFMPLWSPALVNASMFGNAVERHQLINFLYKFSSLVMPVLFGLTFLFHVKIQRKAVKWMLYLSGVILPVILFRPFIGELIGSRKNVVESLSSYLSETDPVSWALSGDLTNFYTLSNILSIIWVLFTIQGYLALKREKPASVSKIFKVGLVSLLTMVVTHSVLSFFALDYFSRTRFFLMDIHRFNALLYLLTLPLVGYGISEQIIKWGKNKQAIFQALAIVGVMALIFGNTLHGTFVSTDYKSKTIEDYVDDFESDLASDNFVDIVTEYYSCTYRKNCKNSIK